MMDISSSCNPQLNPKKKTRANKQEYDEKMTQLTVKSETISAVISNQLNTLGLSPNHKDTSNSTGDTTMVLDNRRAPLLEKGILYQNWWHVDSQI